jgi:hypothetical protein
LKAAEYGLTDQVGVRVAECEAFAEMVLLFTLDWSSPDQQLLQQQSMA